MKDLGVHLALFALVVTAIVAMNAVYGEPDDAKALRSLPRRLLWFLGGCGVLALVLLAIEHTLASVD